MDISNTLQLLARDPDLVAWRLRGVAIRMTEGHVIERVFVKTPYRWMPKYGDLIAADWQCGTVEQFRKQAQAALEATG